LAEMEAQKNSNCVGLCTTCLVDQVFPQVGVATTRLLRRAGFKVEFPEEQTCCGQPFYNSGFQREAKQLARRTVEIFEDYQAVVLPSGSCTSMIRQEYEHLLGEDIGWRERARNMAAKTYELTEFLVAKTNLEVSSPVDGETITYHDSCHMNRKLGIKEAPRKLLRQAGFRIEEMEESDRCCGFGGLFSVHMPEVSQAMTEEKLLQARQTKSTVLVSSDPGCLMQMKRTLGEDKSIQVKHIAEILEKVTE